MEAFPETVALRPLMWANGPAPGFYYWPSSQSVLVCDKIKSLWTNSHLHKSKALTKKETSFVHGCFAVTSLTYIVIQCRL